MSFKYSEEDYCDYYENKICDNCAKCLENEGIDIRAIKIEDIAKTIEENKILEEEFKANLPEEFKEYKDTVDLDTLKEAYEKFQKDNNINLEDEEYEDAFDHIEYLEEDIFSNADLEDMTEEIFPGVRRLKK